MFLPLIYGILNSGLTGFFPPPHCSPLSLIEFHSPGLSKTNIKTIKSLIDVITER